MTLSGMHENIQLNVNLVSRFCYTALRLMTIILRLGIMFEESLTSDYLGTSQGLERDV